MGAALGLDLTGLIKAANEPLTPDRTARLENFARRRLAGEPVARILGIKEFWGLPLNLSAERWYRGRTPKHWSSWRWKCCAPMPRRTVRAYRRSRHRLGRDFAGAAVRIAGRERRWDRHQRGGAADRGSQRRPLGLPSRATFIACDYAAGLHGPVRPDRVNPPYIRSRRHRWPGRRGPRPRSASALDGGADGLDAYRGLIPEAARLLEPGGALVVEAGQGQSGRIEGLMTAAGLMP